MLMQVTLRDYTYDCKKKLTVFDICCELCDLVYMDARYSSGATPRNRTLRPKRGTIQVHTVAQARHHIATRRDSGVTLSECCISQKQLGLNMSSGMT